MPTSPTTRVLEHLRRSLPPSDGPALGDGELLGCFIEKCDQAALATLVRRHAGMVWGTCRRLLNYHDAEDAFQATFLVLVRKAASITPREMVGNWLYGVAHQTALQARRSTARRSRREVQVTEMPDTATEQHDPWPDLRPLLDEELSRLPDVYRVVIVLCDLEGRTRREVAGQLGCPEGTVGGRLARARTMLAKRLARRGVVLSVGALAAMLAQNAASAGAPTAVVSNTIGAAARLAAGHATAGVISPNIVALTEGVLKAMLMSKLKAVVAVVLLLGFLATVATALSGHLASARENQPPATEPKVKAPPLPEPELDRPGAALPDLAGTWQGDDWGTVVLRPAKGGGFEGTYSDTFGKDTGRMAVRWSAASRRYEGTWSEGTYRFGRIALDAPKAGAISGAYTTDPKCEHQPGVPSLASLKWNKKNEEKEVFTAWGKEINGLQAGLGFPAGQKRAYTLGESVTIVLRVRNVGKEAVEFRHIGAFFVENQPTITDADGKRVQLPRLGAEGKHLPHTTTVAPGKEVELYNWGFDLRPQGEGSKQEWATIHGVGKFSLQCERVVGPTLSNPNHPNPALDKLATGKLELEVKEAKKPEKPDRDKESVTAWGKEINGLQAGLSFRPGEKRAYAHGETVTLVVRVRNVGKETVKFEYIRQFLDENPPTVTGAVGKAIPQATTDVMGFHVPVEVTLEPGKEVVLESRFHGACGWPYELRPAGGAGKAATKESHLVVGTGKVGIQYERVFGNSSAGGIKLDPALAKLATGKLELEVESDPPAASEKK